MYAFPLYSLTNLPPRNARMRTEKEEDRPRSFIIAIESIAFSRSGSTIDEFPTKFPAFHEVWFRWSPRSASNGHAETRRNGKGLESSHATRWLSLFARLIALRAAGGREKRLLTMRPREGMQEIMVDRDGGRGPREQPPHNGWLMALLSLCLEIFI